MANKIEVTVTDNSAEFLQAKNEAVARAMEACGLLAEGYAKLDCPVDTGNLRNSINHTQTEDMAIVGTNVEYAPYVEYNDNAHHDVGKAHFLRDSISTNLDEYKDIIKSYLKG